MAEADDRPAPGRPADNNLTPPVVYGVNTAYILPALISIFSLQRNASRPVNITLYLQSPIEPHDLDLIDRARDRLGLRLDRRIFPANVLSGFEDYEELPPGAGFPAISLLPLVLPRLVEGRCLFLDADTLVMGDIWELLVLDMGGMPLGACTGLAQVPRPLPFPARTRPERRKRVTNRVDALGFMPGGGNYFNSGVLVMDCHVVRQDPKWQSLAHIDQLGPHGPISAGPDQDRLNEFFFGRWFPVPVSWNLPTGTRRHIATNHRRYRDAPDGLRRQMREAVRDPKIWHYMGRKKPWKGYGIFSWYLTRQAFRDYRKAQKEFTDLMSGDCHEDGNQG